MLEMKRILANIILFVWTCMTMSAQVAPVSEKEDGLQARIEALAADATFSQSVVGICACTADGSLLAGINEEMMLVPDV